MGISICGSQRDSIVCIFPLWVNICSYFPVWTMGYQTSLAIELAYGPLVPRITPIFGEAWQPCIGNYSSRTVAYTMGRRNNITEWGYGVFRTVLETQFCGSMEWNGSKFSQREGSLHVVATAVFCCHGFGSYPEVSRHAEEGLLNLLETRVLFENVSLALGSWHRACLGVDIMALPYCFWAFFFRELEPRSCKKTSFWIYLR